MDKTIQASKSIIIYTDGEIELKVSVKQDTIWLTQKQIAELFDKDVRNFRTLGSGDKLQIK